MSTMTKVFIVLVSVVGMLASALFVAGAAQWMNTKTTVENYQNLYRAELVQRMNTEGLMAARLAMAQDAMAAQAEEMRKIQADLARVNRELGDVRQDLASEQNLRAEAQAGRKRMEEMLTVQNAELTSVQKENQSLRRENVNLQTRNESLASRVLELTSEVTIATDQIRNLQEKLYASQQRNKELEQQLVAAPPTREEPVTEAQPVLVEKAVAGPIHGEIVEVDGRYVSINVGETSGVVEGMPFMVYRDNTYVGDLQIRNVRPKEAGGILTMVAPGQSVQRGDRVEYLD